MAKGKDPKAIRKTTLIPKEKKESKDAKLGILDVMVEMEDGSKINMGCRSIILAMVQPYLCKPQPGITEEKDGGLLINTRSSVPNQKRGNGNFTCSLSELHASGNHSY